MLAPFVFPVALIEAGRVTAEFAEPAPFDGPGGTRYPLSVWTVWTDADWAEQCPSLTVLPLIDSPPVAAGKRAVRQPVVGKVISPDAAAVTVTYNLIDLTPDEVAAAGAILQQQVADAVQQHLDAAVRTRGYDSMATCVTYAGEASVPRFQAEGRAARVWRSAVWDRCYAVLAEVLAGARAPLTPAEMIAELPALVWPD